MSAVHAPDRILLEMAWAAGRLVPALEMETSIMNAKEKLTTTNSAGGTQSRLRSRESLGRIGFTIAEAADALGMRSDALRRLVERHARAEGDETIARLTGGIVARKRNGLGRWLVVLPSELRG